MSVKLLGIILSKNEMIGRQWNARGCAKFLHNTTNSTKAIQNLSVSKVSKDENDADGKRERDESKVFVTRVYCR